jgi:hypothetical protein
MITVLDNFCPHVDVVRESFLASGFGTWTPSSSKVGSGRYEGMNFVGEHRFVLLPLMQHFAGKVVLPNSTFARLTNLGTERAYIHSDRTAGSHTCILYLSDHAEVSGTAFYRHRETGRTEMPLEWLDDEARAREMVEGSEEVFEQLDFVRGIYNRALIFSAPLFHSRFPAHGISTDERSGRLVHVTHFDLIS